MVTLGKMIRYIGNFTLPGYPINFLSFILGFLKMQILDFAIWLNVKDDNFQVEK